ncbi:MAG: hypothetical protein M1168_00900 [Candidatus Marsarchaeota archaeon]|nr:hypothetical protein [Candidatus Marsarchaeota archaeon]MCL5094527.1 hypothetical protein [Candidatus Marsarchaeota archaeon]
MENNFEELVNYLTDIEKQVNKQEVYSLDISKLFEEHNEIVHEINNKQENAKIFAELAGKIEKIENAKINEQKSKAFSQRITIQTNVPVVDQNQNLNIMQNENLHPQQNTNPIPAKSKPENEMLIKDELNKIISSKIIKEIEQAESVAKNQIMKHYLNKKLKAKNLVMVNLSIQDQISELEKIILGLDSNSFNEDQIKVIKKEMNGLYNYINKQGAKNPAPNANLNQDLIDLRKARLYLILSKLSQ